MTRLAQALDDYLTVRRALGFKLERPGQLLAQLVAYLDQAGADTITIEHALAWATLPAGGDTGWWAYRLSAVRGFACWLHTLDPAAEVPPADLLPARRRRATPYLYSDADIAALITVAATLRFPLQTVTYQTLIGLLAVTGLRIGEALRLDCDDLDFEHGLLTVRNSKFGKSRELPLHPTTLNVLRGYLRRADRRRLTADTPAVFVSTAGTRLGYPNVQATFHKLVRRAGLQPRSDLCRPRLHDYADLRVMPISA